MKYLIILLSIFTIGMSQDGKFSGVVYYNYSHDLTEDATNEDTGFDLTRVYFTYNQTISEGLTYNFQTDINSSASPKAVYLKKAKVDWKSPIGKLTIGLQGMNVFNVAEKTWGFRFLQKSPMDFHKFSSSADLGIGYSGKISQVNYSLLVTNGTGYKKSENDKYKKISTQFVYGEKKLVKQDGYNVGLVYTMESYDDASNATKSKNVVGFFGGFSGNGIRLGGEFDTHTNSGSDITQQVMAIYGSYKISEALECLIYYDMYDPDTNTDKDGTNYLSAGVNYTPSKGLIITPNVRITNPEEGDGTTHAMVNFQFKF